jgi:hypothetical protein
MHFNHNVSRGKVIYGFGENLTGVFFIVRFFHYQRLKQIISHLSLHRCLGYRYTFLPILQISSFGNKNPDQMQRLFMVFSGETF